MRRQAPLRNSGPSERPVGSPRLSAPRRAPRSEQAAYSLRGTARQVNQDRFAVEPSVLVVADGVGAKPAGDHAAERVATEALRCARSIGKLVRRGRAWVAEGVDGLERLPALCQGSLRAEVTRRPELAGMACTLTLALVVWPEAWVVHAGDCRCYLWRDGGLRAVTVDQTLANALVESGMLAAADADRSPLRHVLASCITSGSADVRPEVRHVRLAPGDTLLLCTDGVHGALDDRAMGGILASSATAIAAARALVHAARKAGGTDDATAVVARFGH